MATVTILNQDYTIRDKWEDNTILQMEKAQEYINAMPQYLSSYIYSDKDVSLPLDKIFSFYVDWIEIFSDIPRNILEEEISIEDSSEGSLVSLFNMVAKFLGEPQDLEPSQTINFNGVEYHLIESVKTAGGIDKMLGGATFKHFAESQALVKLFNDKKYKKWDYLARITAILFRPDAKEMYEEEVIEMRAKKFKHLPVSEAYKGYFFLLNHTNKLQESLLISLQKAAEVKQQTQLAKVSLMECIGKYKPMKWLKKVFLTNKD